MSDENIGSFFSYNGMHEDDDEKSESWKPVKQHGKALYKKSIDILNLARTICDMMPEEDDDGASTKSLMMQNAHLVPAKIAGAAAMEYYSLMMENAVIIKVNICQLREQLWACKEFHGIEQQYIDVLRNEIEAFRKIFIDWITAFDKQHDLPDEWHLFNDPASFPDDEPFDAKNFFENFDPEDD
ncbi:hypothetical protein [Ferruginibacter sp.]|nr:hypothetical protein [Ferruginibacter sp.]